MLEATFAKAKATVTSGVMLPGVCNSREALTPPPRSRWKSPASITSTANSRADANLLSMRHYELPGRIIKPTETLKAPLKSNWGWTRLNDPVHSRSNIGISGDSGMLGADWNHSGFFFGFTAPGAAFGELGIRTAAKEPSFFLAVLLDAIRLDPGKSRVLENASSPMAIPRMNFATGSAVCRDVLGPARVRPPLVGYCSWYQVAKTCNRRTSAAPSMASPVSRNRRAAAPSRSTTAIR